VAAGRCGVITFWAADAGVITLGIGGDHSIALAELRALAAIHSPLALVQFDSHGDVWI